MSRPAAATPALFDSARFRSACARFATGITVATVTSREGAAYGLTANSFTSVSFSPPLILICVDHRSSLLAHFRNSSYFGVNILSDGQRELSVRFSRPTVEDRFDGIAWRLSNLGVPVLLGVLASLECAVSQIIDAGDHAVFIGEVIHAEYGEGNPLIYYGSRYCSVAN